MAGKGSRTRPRLVPQATFERNWDLIFKKKSEEPITPKKETK